MAGRPPARADINSCEDEGKRQWQRRWRRRRKWNWQRQWQPLLNRNGEAEPNLPLRTQAMAKPSTPANRDGEAEPECGHATLVAVMTQAEQPNATTHACDWGLTLGARCYLFRIGRARSVRPFPPDTAPRKGPEVKPQSQSSRSGDDATKTRLSLKPEPPTATATATTALARQRTTNT